MQKQRGAMRQQQCTVRQQLGPLLGMALGYSLGSMLGLGVVGYKCTWSLMRMSAGMAAKVANNRKGSGNGISRNNNREGSWDMQERD